MEFSTERNYFSCCHFPDLRKVCMLTLDKLFNFKVLMIFSTRVVLVKGITVGGSYKNIDCGCDSNN